MTSASGLVQTTAFLCVFSAPSVPSVLKAFRFFRDARAVKPLTAEKTEDTEKALRRADSVLN